MVQASNEINEYAVSAPNLARIGLTDTGQAHDTLTRVRMGPMFFGCSIPQQATKDCSTRITREDAQRIFEIIKPQACPHPLVRLGNGADGSYLVPDDFEGITGCLSPGVFNVKHFEDDLALGYGIPSDMLDGSTDLEALATPLIRPLQTFSKLWLDEEGRPNSMSIRQWLKSKPPQEKDFILQMDIEGAEYRNILATENADLGRFRIVVMELHRVAAAFSRPRIFHQVLKPFLEKLSKDFICVHAHPNNASYAYTPPALGIPVPNLLEVTLLRRDRFKSRDTTTYHPATLPHPLDITNVPGHRPLSLSQDWFSGSRPAAARLKIIKDWLEFYKVHKARGNAKNLATAQIKMLIRNVVRG